MNELRVTGQTTLAELQSFADKVGDQAKIRGEKHADGSVTLYASTKKSGVWHNFGHARANRQEAAQDAVRMVLKAVGGENHDAAMASVLKQLPGRGKELLGDPFKSLVGAAAAARADASQDARLSRDIAVHLSAALADAGLNLLNPDQAKALSAELGSLFARWADDRPASEQIGYKADRSTIEGKLLGVMRSYVPSLGTIGGERGAKALTEIMKGASEAAVTRFGDKMNEDGSLTIGERTFYKGANVAKGGFGSVDVWSTKPEDGKPIERIAVKTPTIIPDTPRADILKKMEEAAHEVDVHLAALGGSIDSPSSGIVGLKGCVCLPDGGFVIAMELCDKGSAFSVCKTLDAKAKDAALTPADLRLAKLTIAKDMVGALREFQEVRGMTHLDVKGPNFFMTSEGVTKLGDFGTSATSTSVALLENPIANPLWAAPELTNGNAARLDTIKKFQTARATVLAEAISKLDASLSADVRAILTSNLETLSELTQGVFEKQQTFTVTNKADTWSLGVEIYYMFTGAYPFDASWSSQIWTQLEAFGRDPNARVHLPADKQPASGLSDTEWQQLDQLISGMLHPDPSQRPSLAQVLGSPLLNQPGIGGAQARQTLANA